MSKGNTSVCVRLNDELWEAIDTDLQRLYLHASGAEMTVSDWIRKAISEKLAKGKRSRVTRSNRHSKKGV